MSGIEPIARQMRINNRSPTGICEVIMHIS